MRSVISGSEKAGSRKIRAGVGIEFGQWREENSTQFRLARSIRQTCRKEVSYVSRALFFAQIPLFRHPAGFTTLVMKTASQSVDSLQ